MRLRSLVGLKKEKQSDRSCLAVESLTAHEQGQCLSEGVGFALAKATQIRDGMSGPVSVSVRRLPSLGETSEYDKSHSRKERSREQMAGVDHQREVAVLVSASALRVGQGRVHDAAPCDVPFDKEQSF